MSSAYSSSSSVLEKTGGDDNRDVLIFYLTGNPGLVGYYKTFLERLTSLLNNAYSSRFERRFFYYGSSLAGYDIDSGLGPNIVTNLPDFSIAKAQARRPPNWRHHRKPYLVEDQVQFKLKELKALLKAESAQDREYDVVIVGHSMGCYIILEMLQRLRSDPEMDRQPAGSIMLFPTVMEIAMSQSGMTIGRLFVVPLFAAFAQFAVSMLILLLPYSTVLWILVKIGQQPAGLKGATTTAALASTPGLIKQTILLAADEMRTITTDKWDHEIWGAAEVVPPAPNTVFFFAAEDHWVADKTRDDLISLRAMRKGKKWGPKMYIDSTGITHAFCFYHSESVAERCVPWVLDMVGIHDKQLLDTAIDEADPSSREATPTRIEPRKPMDIKVAVAKAEKGRTFNYLRSRAKSRSINSLEMVKSAPERGNTL